MENLVIEKGVLTKVKLKNKLEKVVIPSTVKVISAKVFKSAKLLKEISFDEDSLLEELQEECFSNCEFLLKVDLSNCIHLKAVPVHAFSKCQQLNQVKLPANIEIIDNFSFKKCSSLESINLEETKTYLIGKHAFHSCESLAKIDLPTSLTSLFESAFNGASSLKTIYIPENVVNIEKGVFINCNALKEISVAEKNKNYVVQDNVLFSKDLSTVFHYTCHNEEAIVLPMTVSNIEDSAFYKCLNLKAVHLPNNVKISNFTFGGCSELKIYIEGKVNSSSPDSWNFDGLPVYENFSREDFIKQFTPKIIEFNLASKQRLVTKLKKNPKLLFALEDDVKYKLENIQLALEKDKSIIKGLDVQKISIEDSLELFMKFKNIQLINPNIVHSSKELKKLINYMGGKYFTDWLASLSRDDLPLNSLKMILINLGRESYLKRDFNIFVLRKKNKSMFKLVLNTLLEEEITLTNPVFNHASYMRLDGKTKSKLLKVLKFTDIDKVLLKSIIEHDDIELYKKILNSEKEKQHQDEIAEHMMLAQEYSSFKILTMIIRLTNEHSEVALQDIILSKINTNFELAKKLLNENKHSFIYDTDFLKSLLNKSHVNLDSIEIFSMLEESFYKDEQVVRIIKEKHLELFEHLTDLSLLTLDQVNKILAFSLENTFKLPKSYLSNLDVVYAALKAYASGSYSYQSKNEHALSKLFSTVQELLINNLDFTQKVISKFPFYYKYLPLELQLNEEIILFATAIKENYQAIPKVIFEQEQYLNIAKKIVEHAQNKNDKEVYSIGLQFILKNKMEDEQFIIENYKHLSNDMQCKSDYIEIIKNNYYRFFREMFSDDYVNEYELEEYSQFHDDPEFYFNALDFFSDDFYFYHKKVFIVDLMMANIDKDFFKDINMVKKLLEYYQEVPYRLIDLIPQNFFSDKELAIQLCDSAGEVLSYLSDDLKKDKTVVIHAVNNKGTVIRYADAKLKEDIDVCSVAYKNSSYANRYIGSRIKAMPNYKKILKAHKVKW